MKKTLSALDSLVYRFETRIIAVALSVMSATVFMDVLHRRISDDSYRLGEWLAVILGATEGSDLGRTLQRPIAPVLTWLLVLALLGFVAGQWERLRPPAARLSFAVIGAAVLYGRGRLADDPVFGAHATSDALLEQLEIVSDSCECDRPRSWLTARHLPLPWNESLRTRARDLLGFDPHSPRIRDEIDRILARGPRPNGGRAVGEVVIDDPLLGYEEVVLQPPAAIAPSQGPPRRFGAALFWLCIGLAAVALLALGVHFATKDAV